MRQLSHAAAAALLAATAAALPAASAADYPDRPVRMVVGFSPGGGTDVMARLIGPKLTAAWRQQVVVDNRPGATGMVGAELVARANPDGYTILMGHVASNAIAPNLYRKVPFDPIKDFAPVTLVASVPHIVVAHPSLPMRTIKELVAAAKAAPGKLSFPSAGAGSTPHLAGEIFKLMTGTDILHVPYKGSGQSLPDLLGGQVKVAFDTTPTVITHVKAGRLRPLAVTSPRRLASLPEVPTVEEAGVKGYTFSTWYGMFAPARTPADIVARLHDDTAKALVMPDVRERLVGVIGADDSVTRTPADFAAMVRTDLARYAKVVKALKLRVD